MTPLQRLLTCLGLALAVLGLGACEKHRFEDTKVLYGDHHGHAGEPGDDASEGEAGDAAIDEGAGGVARDLGV